MAREVRVALLVRMEALPGREEEAAEFLRKALGLVEQEPATARWFGVRFGPSSFGIFDAFPDASGRQAHIDGAVAKALQANVGALFAQPTFEPAEVLAERPPV